MRHQHVRGHWILLLLGSVALLAALVINGAARGEVGESAGHEPLTGAGLEPPESVIRGGPLLNLTEGGRARSARPAAKTIALTFDDGPDPQWTPKLLDVLRKHGARATFFTVGARVAEHPGLARRMVREGHELGSHTYTHIDMARSPDWRIRLELNLTQQALAGTVGIKTRLVRMPYSSTPQGLTSGQWRAARVAGDHGYLVVLTDRDTEDWALPGTDRIVARAVTARRPGEGAIVMLHDSGGDRSTTIEAVDRILTELGPQGYRFTTVSESVGLPYASVPATSGERMVGRALVYAQFGSAWVIKVLAALFVLTGILTVARVGMMLVLAHVHVRRVRGHRGRRRRGRGGRPGAGDAPPGPAPSVSVVVPAYNEAVNIGATVRSLLDTDYPGSVEVIVVDDGSTDGTGDVVRALGLPGVRLIRKPNGGKPSALNAGIVAATAEIIVLVDGDTVFQRDTLGRLVAPLADPSVGAVSGNTKVANRGGFLGRWQHLEYVIGFNLDRRLYDVLQCMPTVPGAIGAFRRRALTSVGGVSDDTLAEDTDLTMAICRAGWRVVYAEDAIAWTEVPSSVRQLWRQRYRWCYGTIQAMWKHRRSLTEPGRAGRFGRRCLPYLMVFHVLLPLFSPVMDLFVLYGMLFLDPLPLVTTWVVLLCVQALCGAYALRLDGERLRTLWALPFQQVVYRQLMYLVVIQSLVTAVLGIRLRWQAIRRTGTFASDGRSVPDGSGV